jgi:hypothetical protein
LLIESEQLFSVSLKRFFMKVSPTSGENTITPFELLAICNFIPFLLIAMCQQDGPSSLLTNQDWQSNLDIEPWDVNYSQLFHLSIK